MRGNLFLSPIFYGIILSVICIVEKGVWNDMNGIITLFMQMFHKGPIHNDEFETFKNAGEEIEKVLFCDELNHSNYVRNCLFIISFFVP